MKSFRQYIEEALTQSDIAMAKRNMARIAKKVMAAQVKKKVVKRNSGINWADMSGDHVTAWWHPTKPAHIFTWVFGKRHHMNEIVNYPSVFGVTQAHINKAIEQYVEEFNYTRGTPDWDGAMQISLNKFKDGRVDSYAPMANLAYKNGWIQVRKKGMIRMEGEFGGSRKSMKALFREILDSIDSATGPRPEQFNMSLFFPGENIALGRIRSREDMEKLINS